MDIDATFLPAAVNLIDNVFPTDIIYSQPNASIYDPLTGDITPGGTVDFPIKAGILKRGRVEKGGSSESYEMHLWIHHGASGLSSIPTTADSILYDNRRWKVVSIEPTYSSKQLIASRIICRAA